MTVRKPRMLFVSSSYPANPKDWRSRFILDMLESLAKQGGYGAGPLYWGPLGHLPPGVRAVLSDADAAWLEALTARGGLAHLLRSSPLAGVVAGAGFIRRLRAGCRRSASEYDVAHVNWLQNLLGLPRDGRPALITVLGSDFGLLRFPGVAPLLRHAMHGRRCILSPNATWMAPRLKTLFGAVADVVPVPFGVDSAWYGLTRRDEGVPRRWLVVARVTRGKIGRLFEWGESVFRGNDELHLLGPMQENLAIPEWVHYHGPTHPEALRSDWFPMAHGLVTLSSHDEGRPQVLLEAMAAGIPVVASMIPAHADVVSNGETGFLVDSASSLGAAIAALRDAGDARAIGARARAWMQGNFGTWRDTAARYATLHAKLVCAHEG